MSLLESRNLCKYYRLGHNHEVRALQEVSFSMEKGCWLAISGPSGSGKSTLLAILAALDRPSSGEVFFNGENLSGANDVRLARYRKEKIGVVFQEYQLFEELSGLENVCMPLVVSNLNRKEQKERAMILLDRSMSISKQPLIVTEKQTLNITDLTPLTKIYYKPDIWFGVDITLK